MQEPAATVFVVDDDAAVRSSLRLLLRSLGYATEAFDSAQAFLSAYRDRPGCLLLDVRMPGLSGPELQRELNLRGTIIPVVFISGHADVSMAVEAMRCGAFDFLQKPFRDQELIDRVERALRTDSDRRAQLQERQATHQRLASLTQREHDVLDRVIAGSSNKVIAYHLGISQRTIEVHRARIMEKMRANSLAQLVRMTLPTRAKQQPRRPSPSGFPKDATPQVDNSSQRP